MLHYWNNLLSQIEQHTNNLAKQHIYNLAYANIMRNISQKVESRMNKDLDKAIAELTKDFDLDLDDLVNQGIFETVYKDGQKCYKLVENQKNKIPTRKYN